MSIVGFVVIILFVLVVLIFIFLGLCYVEFGVCVFKIIGLVYVYSYIIVGEIWVFIIGWNLILEYMIGMVVDVRVLSVCFDYVIGNVIRNLILIYIGEINIFGFGIYFDILFFIVIIMVIIVLVIGVK